MVPLLIIDEIVPSTGLAIASLLTLETPYESPEMVPLLVIEEMILALLIPMSPEIVPLFTRLPIIAVLNTPLRAAVMFPLLSKVPIVAP